MMTVAGGMNESDNQTRTNPGVNKVLRHESCDPRLENISNDYQRIKIILLLSCGLNLLNGNETSTAFTPE